jgi:hypothetical protein
MSDSKARATPYCIPKVDLVAPKANLVGRKVDLVAPKVDLVAPNVDLVVPTCMHIYMYGYKKEEYIYIYLCIYIYMPSIGGSTKLGHDSQSRMNYWLPAIWRDGWDSESQIDPHVLSSRLRAGRSRSAARACSLLSNRESSKFQICRSHA